MPVKRINTRQPVAASSAKPGCLARVGKWGIGALIVLVGCGVLANLAPRTPATIPATTAPVETAVRSAAVAIEPATATIAATQPAPAATVAPTATSTATRPTATNTATVAPTATSTATATATRPAATNTATVAPTATATRPAATNTATVAPTATSTATATATRPAPTATASGPVANNTANLREGPGADYPVIGGATAGQPLALVGQNSAGDWLQLDSGAWIAAALVAGVPAGLPVISAAPAPTADAAIAAPPVEQPNAFTCIGGCATPPDASCAIKGNVNSKGDKIYHMPGWRDYERADIKPEEGDVWFCTAEEAEAAGFRAPLNH